MTDKRNKPASKPTKQEIQFYLDSLNRTQSAAIVSPDTEAAKAIGVDNYRKWFKQRGIVIYKDNKDVWHLGEVLHDIGVKQEK